MTCPHGEAHASVCIECIEGVPAPRKQIKHETEHTMQARYDGPCAVDERHRIEEGQTIGLVEGIGWACFRCIER